MGDEENWTGRVRLNESLELVFLQEMKNRNVEPDVAVYVGGVLVQPRILRPDYVGDCLPSDWCPQDILCAARFTKDPTVARRCADTLLVTAGAFGERLTSRPRRANLSISYIDQMIGECYHLGLPLTWHPLSDTLGKLSENPSVVREAITAMFRYFRKNDRYQAHINELEREASRH